MLKKRLIISLTFLDGVYLEPKNLNPIIDIQRTLSICGALMS